MNDDDRKFLTEAMGGECWNENSPCKNRTFTTWDDFGAVWEWAKKQEWWDKFTDLHYHCCRVDLDLIDPIRFPELVVQFLKERKP